MSASNVRPADGMARRGARQLEGVRVLVVDDDADTRELLAMVLEVYGAQTTMADSVPAALRELERSRADVLLSDLNIAGEDGFSLIRRVRALGAERGGQIPAAALTGYAGGNERTQALAAGFQMLITKPAEPEELVKVILHLAGRRLQDHA